MAMSTLLVTEVLRFGRFSAQNPKSMLGQQLGLFRIIPDTLIMEGEAWCVEWHSSRSTFTENPPCALNVLALDVVLGTSPYGSLQRHGLWTSFIFCPATYISEPNTRQLKHSLPPKFECFTPHLRSEPPTPLRCSTSRLTRKQEINACRLSDPHTPCLHEKCWHKSLYHDSALFLRLSRQSNLRLDD